MTDLHAHLLAAEARHDRTAAIARDPIRFARRYAAPLDREIAGLVASSYAAGRVSLFGPVLDRAFAAFDARGGPAAFVLGYDPRRDRGALDGVAYRFWLPSDLALLVGALRDVLSLHGSLAAFFPPPDALAPRGGRVGQGLDSLVRALRAAAAERVDPADPPRGFRQFLPTPTDGSACKRLNLWLRWMVRADDGVDFGLWSAVAPADLVIPLDVHVLRISRFIGLTGRADASWRTACEVTTALARLDPVDPVRFDFALSHLGISGACRGARHVEACPLCPLDPVCTAGEAEVP